MKQINQMIYKEMDKMGLLKIEYKVVDEITDEGKRVYDKHGNPKKKSITNKNFIIANKNKSSKTKTIFVEDRVLEQYLKLKNKP